MNTEKLFTEFDHLFDQMISFQRKKILKHAQKINPKITSDDILQPFDFPEIGGNPAFQFEDGILAGLISAQAAVRAKLRDLDLDPSNQKA